MGYKSSIFLLFFFFYERAQFQVYRIQNIDNKNMRISNDIECYPNFFSCAVVDLDSDRKKYMEVSPRRNDWGEIKRFFSKVQYCVGFNSKDYDDFVLVNTLKECSSDASWEEVTRTAYRYSCTSIDSDFVERYRCPWVQVDLFLYWSRLIRMSKKISLKGLAVAIGWHWIQELPVEPGTVLTLEQMEKMPAYNMNDALITKALHNKHMKKMVDFRIGLYQALGKDYMSSDAPAIGMDILLSKYCEKVGETAWEVKNKPKENQEFLIGDVIMPEFRKRLREPKFISVLEEFSKFRHTKGSSLSMTRIYGNCEISLGLGGIHSIDRPELIEPKPGWKYVSSDATSYYPNLASGQKRLFFPRHLGREILREIYKGEFYDGRVRYKKLAKSGDKDAELKNELYKLILNAYTGNLKNEYSPFMDHWANVGITVNGQLGLLYFAQEVVEKGFILKSLNTDGIEVLYPAERHEEYMAICKDWEELMEIPLEHTYFKKCFRRDVNNYMALDSEGDLKKKGFFKKPELEDSHSFQIIPKAFRNWFVTGESPYEFIRNPENSILDFCDAPKSDKKFKIYWGEEKVARLNRFFVSKKGRYLYKADGDKKSNMLKGYGVMLCNTVDPNNLQISNYPDIDFRFYDTQIRDLMNQVISNQTTLF